MKSIAVAVVVTLFASLARADQDTPVKYSDNEVVQLFARDGLATAEVGPIRLDNGRIGADGDLLTIEYDLAGGAEKSIYVAECIGSGRYVIGLGGITFTDSSGDSFDYPIFPSSTAFIPVVWYSLTFDRTARSDHILLRISLSHILDTMSRNGFVSKGRREFIARPYITIVAFRDFEAVAVEGSKSASARRVWAASMDAIYDGQALRIVHKRQPVTLDR